VSTQKIDTAVALAGLIFCNRSGLAAVDQWPDEGVAMNSSRPGKEETLLRDRFEHASKKTLGSAVDVATINQQTLAHLKYSHSRVNEIRWLAPTLVMVSAGWSASKPVFAEECFYVWEKKNGSWHVLRRYLMACT
jgi:hypothetical protein